MREKIRHALIYNYPPPPLYCFENFLSPKIKPKFGDSTTFVINICILLLHIHANVTRVISIYFECRWTKNSKKVSASEKKYPLPNDSV